MGFADNLKKAREKRGLTQEQLAVKTNCTKSMICKMEKGEAIPGTALAVRLAKSLKTTVEKLWD